MCFKVRETYIKQLCIERLMNMRPGAYRSLTLDFPVAQWLNVHVQGLCYCSSYCFKD